MPVDVEEAVQTLHNIIDRHGIAIMIQCFQRNASPIEAMGQWGREGKVIQAMAYAPPFAVARGPAETRSRHGFPSQPQSQSQPSLPSHASQSPIRPAARHG